MRPNSDGRAERERERERESNLSGCPEKTLGSEEEEAEAGRQVVSSSGGDREEGAKSRSFVYVAVAENSVRASG